MCYGLVSEIKAVTAWLIDRLKDKNNVLGAGKQIKQYMGFRSVTLVRSPSNLSRLCSCCCHRGWQSLREFAGFIWWMSSSSEGLRTVIRPSLRLESQVGLQAAVHCLHDHRSPFIIKYTLIYRSARASRLTRRVAALSVCSRWWKLSHRYKYKLPTREFGR